MNILMISPQSPPKNSPESMQVKRYLEELDKQNNITLVNTPSDGGWVTNDDTLKVSLINTHVITMKLWFHKFIIRSLHSRFLKDYLVPDETAWIRYMTSYVLRRNTRVADIIYSRSVPFSAALLAMDLKKRLQVPWVMHLSDPWFDSPYRKKTNKEKILENYEASCFEYADAIMVTTESMSSFYRNKYPNYAHKVSVSSNVMPAAVNKNNITNKNEKLTLLYTGAMYGDRRPTTILKALLWLKENHPDVLNTITIVVIGNMTEEIKNEINFYGFEQITVLGRKRYAEVIEWQENADVLISIEPDGTSPLLKTFLPSKVLDYMASSKPILAITPKNSETWKLCEQGFGWQVKPEDSVGLGKLLVKLSSNHDSGKICYKPKNYLLEYTAAYNVQKLVKIMETLIIKTTSGNLMRILLIGYYGKANFGDDVLFKVTYTYVRKWKPSAEIFVLCDQYQEDYLKDLVEGSYDNSSTRE